MKTQTCFVITEIKNRQTCAIDLLFLDVPFNNYMQKHKYVFSLRNCLLITTMSHI